MNIYVTAKPVFHFTLNAELNNVFIRMSEHHYDYLCKMASQMGGFLFGFRNILAWGLAPDEISKDVDLSFRDLDLLFKICENMAVLEKDEVLLVSRFVRNMQKAINHVEDHFANWRFTLANDTIVSQSKKKHNWIEIDDSHVSHQAFDLTSQWTDCGVRMLGRNTRIAPAEKEHCSACEDFLKKHG
jgi:hypothetical protein